MFGPGTLASISLAIIVIPIALTLLLALTSENAANSGAAYLAIAGLQFGSLGLVVSGLWWVAQGFF